jgi:hypothetical protein
MAAVAAANPFTNERRSIGSYPFSVSYCIYTMGG